MEKEKKCEHTEKQVYCPYCGWNKESKNVICQCELNTDTVGCEDDSRDSL